MNSVAMINLLFCLFSGISCPSAISLLQLVPLLQLSTYRVNCITREHKNVIGYYLLNKNDQFYVIPTDYLSTQLTQSTSFTLNKWVGVLLSKSCLCVVVGYQSDNYDGVSHEHLMYNDVPTKMFIVQRVNLMLQH